MGADEPSGWSSLPLGRLVAVKKGRKVPTSQVQEPGLEPYLGAAALTGEPTEFADPCLGVCSSPSDVLILWDGERSGLVGRGRHGVVSSTVASLSPTKWVVTEFLVHLLKWKYAWIQAQRTGTGVPHVPADLTTRLSLSVPSDLAEQRRIAEILDTLDEASRKTQLLIAKLKQVKLGLLHDLLTRGIDENGVLRDPVADREQFKESAVGRIPKAWEVRTLGVLTKVTVGHVGPIEQHFTAANDGVPLLSTSHIGEHGALLGEIRRVTSTFHASHSKSMVTPGDIIVARHGKSGSAALIPEEFSQAQSLNVVIVRQCTVLDGEYLTQVLNHPETRRRLLSGQAGSVQAIVGTKGVARLQLAIAPVEEQRRIVRTYCAFSARLDAEQKVLSKLHLLKQALAKDLLTGRVRVTNLASERAA